MNLAFNLGYLLGKCENLCKNRLTTMNLHNLKRPIRKVCQLQSDDFYFLNDYKGFVSKFGDDENIIYYIANVDNGRVFAKANYSKKSNRNAETHISVDNIKNELVFRYIELLPFEDTLFYRKQHIDKVNKIEDNLDNDDDEKISFNNNDKNLSENNDVENNNDNINEIGGSNNISNNASNNGNKINNENNSNNDNNKEKEGIDVEENEMFSGENA